MSIQQTLNNLDAKVYQGLETLKQANTANFHQSKVLPGLSQTPSRVRQIGFDRIVRIGLEALPIIQLFHSKAMPVGTLLGLGYDSITAFTRGSTKTFLCSTVYAAAYIAKPALVGRVSHLASGVFNLWQGNFVRSAYDFSYVAMLATANPQIVAIVLVSQTVFSFVRACEWAKHGQMIEAAINVAATVISGRSAYQHRDDLFVSFDKYKQAYSEASVCAINFFNEVREVAKTGILELLKKIHLEAIPAWGQIEDELDDAESVNDLVVCFQKILAVLNSYDYYLTKKDFKKEQKDMDKALKELKKYGSSYEYNTLKPYIKQIEAHLKQHIK